MERSEKRNRYRLSTGREVWANDGLISINQRPDGEFRIAEGYDGMLFGATGDAGEPEDMREGELPENWSREEKMELAEFMIARWTAFRDLL